MTKQVVSFNRNDGGWATDKKIGLAHSFAYSQSMDFRSKPSQLSVLSQPAKESENTISDLVQQEVMTLSGDSYAIGDEGKFYKRTAAGAWSLIGSLDPGTFGLVYRPDQDSLYIASAKAVSMFNPVSSSPTLSPNVFNISKSLYDDSDAMGFNVSAYQAAGSATTAISTSFLTDEIDVQRRFFQTDIEPLNSIALYIVTKGTGNWTLTLHNGLNQTIGTATLTNANIIEGEFNRFVFSDPIRAQVAPAAQTYHIHVTSTVADGTVSSDTANDLSSCALEVYADRLVEPTNGMHPMSVFQQFVLIGNEHYLSVWEPLGTISPTNEEWQRHKLQFPPGYEVCGIATFNEYAAIACERVTTSPDDTVQDGIIFFWDGLSNSYNYWIQVPEGSPYGIHNHSNVLYYFAGGSWWAVESIVSEPRKIRTMPFGESQYQNANVETKIYPYAVTVRNGVKLMAWPSVTTNENIPYGVYSWGQVDQNFPMSFGYSYLLSTGSTNYDVTNDLSIGMVQSFGDQLHISWRDGDDCGVDVVDSDSPPATYSTWESLIFDNGYVGKQKQADYMEATWVAPLPDDVEIVLKYKINRGEWIYSEAFSATNLWQGNEGYARFDIAQPARFYEIQIGIDVYCSGTELSPEITSRSLVFDNNDSEVLQ